MHSLQSLCLNSIIDNFYRFHWAFILSEDATMQRNLNFLQRKFCNYLAKQLLRNGEKTDVYFDFLINRHLTSLNFRWFERNEYLKSIDDIFRRLPNLTRITFKSCGDEVVKSGAKFCPKIVEIYADDKNFTDEGIKYLCETKDGMSSCPELKKIEILENSCVTDKGAEYLLRNLPSIELFNYERLPLVLHSIHTGDLSEPQKVPFFNLTELDLTCCRNTPHYTEVLKACITLCPKLESLECSLSSKEELDALNNSQLKNLILSFHKRKLIINLDEFIKANGRNLRCLQICYCTVSASTLSVHCPRLKYLHLNDVDFTDNGDLKTFFPSLTECCFCHYALKRTAITKVFHLLSSSSPKLESVIFNQCRMSHDLRKQILIWCSTHAVSNVVFERIVLKIKFVEDLILKCHSLKRLEVSSCVWDIARRAARGILKTLIAAHLNRPRLVYY